MRNNDLKIEYLPVADLKPYENNARKHEDADVQTIVASIQEFGFDDPIGIWGKDNLIVEGHGRLLAAKKLNMETVPVIRLDHLTDEQRRAYALAHNKTAEMSQWDFDVLGGELDDILNIDMAMFGFDAETEDNESEGEYTKKTDIPQYDVQGDEVSLEQLVDREKAHELIEEIEVSNVSEDEKTFLKLAARRHYVFNYKKIAEYYAQTSEEMQKLMERSALVIIDYDNAIANGYIKLSKRLEELRIGDA